MSIAENKAVIQRIYDHWNQGGAISSEKFLAPDFVNHAVPPGVPSGPESFKWLDTVYRAAFPDTQDTLEELLADGDKVIGCVLHQATHQGTYFGIPPTGKRVRYTSTFIWRIADGRIAELWGDTDRLGLLQQLGVILQPGTAAGSALRSTDSQTVVGRS